MQSLSIPNDNQPHVSTVTLSGKQYPLRIVGNNPHFEEPEFFDKSSETWLKRVKLI